MIIQNVVSLCIVLRLAAPCSSPCFNCSEDNGFGPSYRNVSSSNVRNSNQNRRSQEGNDIFSYVLQHLDDIPDVRNCPMHIGMPLPDNNIDAILSSVRFFIYYEWNSVVYSNVIVWY